MMYDLQNLISNRQALTTGTQLGTNVIDLWAGIAASQGGTDNNGNTLLRDLGRAPEVAIDVQVVEDFTGGTSEDFRLVTGADGDAALGSPTVIMSTGAIVEANLKAGKVIPLAILPGAIPATARYLGLQCVAVGTHSTGKITAGIRGEMGRQSSPSSML
jgi:hypothetical protein